MQRETRPEAAHASCGVPGIAESIPPRLSEKNTAPTVAPQADDLTHRAARERRAVRDGQEAASLQQPTLFADAATYCDIEEFAETASEIVDALVWAAQQGDRRRCALYVRQLAATVRTLLLTVGDLFATSGNPT
jgi:hypothetical protein